MSARSSRVLAGVFLVGAVVGAILGWMGRARVDETREGGRPEPVESTDVDGQAGGASGPGPAVAETAPGTPAPLARLKEAPPILAAADGGGSARTGAEILATGTATLIVTLRGATPAVAQSAIV